jgi:hypothetical protein
MIQYKNLHPSAAFLFAEKPGRYDPGIVHHQQITGFEQSGKIVKKMIGKGPPAAIYNKKVRVVAPLCRDLGDQVLRQFIVVIVDIEHSRNRQS